jgi:hypothetical protein
MKLSSAAGMQAAVIGLRWSGVIFVFGAGGCVRRVLCAVIGCVLGSAVPATTATTAAVNHATHPAGGAGCAAARRYWSAVSLDLFAVLLGSCDGCCRCLPRTSCVGPGAWACGQHTVQRIDLWSLTRWPLERRVGRTVMLSPWRLWRCAWWCLASTSFVLSLVVLAISGSADMVNVVVRQTLVRWKPDEMRGRVSHQLGVRASNQLANLSRAPLR